jgi:hypothetical protein
MAAGYILRTHLLAIAIQAEHWFTGVISFGD